MLVELASVVSGKNEVLEDVTSIVVIGKITVVERSDVWSVEFEIGESVTVNDEPVVGGIEDPAVFGCKDVPVVGGIEDPAVVGGKDVPVVRGIEDPTVVGGNENPSVVC